MKFPAYLSILGAQQGLITQGVSTSESMGNKWQSDHQDEILVQGIAHAMSMTNSQREYEPLVILKEIDKCSPLLRAALASGETLLECVLKMYRINALGQLENYFTVTLYDAVLADIELEAPALPEMSENSDKPQWLLEKLSLRYRKIEWRHDISGTMSTDIWETGLATEQQS